ncbi:MAG TPA: transglycosylase domain-containing protein, partial [Myxococcales bacterium]|nr:transglycosylase domain-containing protein [Myxococcales bacterium]
MRPPPAAEPTPGPSPVVAPPSPPTRRSRIVRALKRLLLFALALVVLAAGTVVGGYFYFDRNLPSVETLRTFQPPQVTKVRCADGSVCAEFYLERRTVVPIGQIPEHVRNAFLAAEDADFYKHQGLDYLGMARAFVKSLLPGGRVTGASTITQQACRNVLLSNERTFGRKVREWILSMRMEKALTKDKILELYLNQIVFGHGRYGVEEAAVYYFGKHTRELSMGEAAVLAGLLPSPERFNPVTNVVRARERQKYVLDQLVSKGFYKEAQLAPERTRPIVLGPRAPERVGPYYAEEVRRALVARYGEQAVLGAPCQEDACRDAPRGGMRVDIAMDPRLQAQADRALRDGLEELDRKMGYRGPVGKLEPDRFKVLAALIRKRIAEAGKRKPDEVKIADLTALAPQPQAGTPGAPGTPGTPGAPGQELDEGVEAPRAEAAGAAPAVDEDEEPPPSPDELLSQQVSLRVLGPDVRAVGFVTQVDDAGKKAVVDLVGKTAKVDFATSTWARPRGIGKWTQAPAKMS